MGFGRVFALTTGVLGWQSYLKEGIHNEGNSAKWRGDFWRRAIGHEGIFGKTPLTEAWMKAGKKWEGYCSQAIPDAGWGSNKPPGATYAEWLGDSSCQPNAAGGGGNGAGGQDATSSARLSSYGPVSQYPADNLSPPAQSFVLPNASFQAHPQGKMLSLALFFLPSLSY